MLENSIWHRYHPEATIRSALAALYGCDVAQISGDESLLYAELKRTLTKKELRLFIMREAQIAETEIMEELGLDETAYAASVKKAYHKIRNKVRPHIKSERAAAAVEEAPEE